jgi:X-Pro dipeptidyl-peptidase
VLADFIAKRMKTPQCERMRARLVARQDRETGDWSSFWRARDYLHRVRRVRASVFAVHGLNDFNVKTKAFAAWWDRLSARNIPRKLWLHNGGHGGPGGTAAADYKRTVNRWFDYWLFGVQNGITAEPRVHIQREDGTYHDEADWPAPGTSIATLRLAAADAHAPGTLGTVAVTGGPKQSFVDRGRELDTDDVLITGPDAANPNRLIYRSPALTRDVRMSGTPWVDLRMSIDNRNAANLTAVLVDYGPGGEPAMVTRGWLDPQNRSDPAHSQPVSKGRAYSLHWDLQPDDHVFAAGHRIGLVVVSTDHDYTLRPQPGTELTLDPAASGIRLPIVGGAAALGF